MIIGERVWVGVVCYAFYGVITWSFCFLSGFDLRFLQHYSDWHVRIGNETVWQFLNERRSERLDVLLPGGRSPDSRWYAIFGGRYKQYLTGTFGSVCAATSTVLYCVLYAVRFLGVLFLSVIYLFVWQQVYSKLGNLVPELSSHLGESRPTDYNLNKISTCYVECRCILCAPVMILSLLILSVTLYDGVCRNRWNISL